MEAICVQCIHHRLVGQRDEVHKCLVNATKDYVTGIVKNEYEDCYEKNSDGRCHDFTPGNRGRGQRD